MSSGCEIMNCEYREGSICMHPNSICIYRDEEALEAEVEQLKKELDKTRGDEALMALSDSKKHDEIKRLKAAIASHCKDCAGECADEWKASVCPLDEFRPRDVVGKEK